MAAKPARSVDPAGVRRKKPIFTYYVKSIFFDFIM
jgi:hypothetical protein